VHPVSRSNFPSISGPKTVSVLQKRIRHISEISRTGQRRFKQENPERKGGWVFTVHMNK
ncbi:hypothetical protein BaRGS_00034502, partial [Batillaria attramentaria]